SFRRSLLTCGLMARTPDMCISWRRKVLTSTPSEGASLAPTRARSCSANADAAIARRAHARNQRRHVFRRSIRQNPVTEVEDVTGRRAGCVEHGASFAFDGRRIRQQNERIEIPLYRDTRPDRGTGRFDVCGPVESDGLAAASGDAFKPLR